MDTLATLDLTEKPDQKITWFHHVRHFQDDHAVELPAGDVVFSSGAHHSFYSYTVASDREPEQE